MIPFADFGKTDREIGQKMWGNQWNQQSGFDCVKFETPVRHPSRDVKLAAEI